MLNFFPRAETTPEGEMRGLGVAAVVAWRGAGGSGSSGVPGARGGGVGRERWGGVSAARFGL